MAMKSGFSDQGKNIDWGLREQGVRRTFTSKSQDDGESYVHNGNYHHLCFSLNRIMLIKSRRRNWADHAENIWRWGTHAEFYSKYQARNHFIGEGFDGRREELILNRAYGRVENIKVAQVEKKDSYKHGGLKNKSWGSTEGDKSID
jgi:hypothetical protein